MFFAIAWIALGAYSFLMAVGKGKNPLFWFIFSFVFPYLAFFAAISLEPEKESLYGKANWDYRGVPKNDSDED